MTCITEIVYSLVFVQMLQQV